MALSHGSLLYSGQDLPLIFWGPVKFQKKFTVLGLGEMPKE